MEAQLPDNQYRRIHARLKALPLPERFRHRVFSMGMGLTIPYLSTSSVELLDFGPGSATLRVKNRRKVQNHMQSVHGSAMYLLAEAASGTLVFCNLPDRSRYSVTHGEAIYTRRAVGDLTAHVTLDEAGQRAMREEPKGRLVFPVQLTDQQGNQPACFNIEWAWKHPEPR